MASARTGPGLHKQACKHDELRDARFGALREVLGEVELLGEREHVVNLSHAPDGELVAEAVEMR